MRRLDAAIVRLDPRAAWLLLGLAMFWAALWILWQGRDLSLAADELFYYARLVDDGGAIESHRFGLDYLLAPHNGHLQLGGKLIYEGVFAVFGPDYGVLRGLELLGILAAVALLFELTRRRAGAAVALTASLLVLGMGAAWEPMLWPFDLHTVYALAFGLGALVALELAGRRAEVAACVLLVASVLMIEVGLAFVVGAGILIAGGPRRRARAWIVLVPVALYAGWWAWARRFDQGEIMLSNLSQLPADAFDSLTAVLAALTGLYGHAPDVYPSLVGPDGGAKVLAVVALIALTAFAIRARPGVWFWAFVGTLLTYWAFIGLAARPPDSSRYMLVGAIAVLLVGAEALRSRRYLGPVALALLAVFCVALPAGLAKIADGREQQLVDAVSSRTQYAMLELARERVDRGYQPQSDPVVLAAGPPPFGGLRAGDYFPAADRIGPLGFDLDVVRALDDLYRRVADATLAQALGLSPAPAEAPERGSACRPPAASPVEIGAGSVYVRSTSGAATALMLGRFADAPSLEIGSLEPGRWYVLRIPADSARDRWRLAAAGPIAICAPSA